MKDVVIVSACRSAIGTFGGSLRDLNSPLIAKPVMEAAIQRAGINPDIINEVRFGSCAEHSDNMNVARITSQLAGVPSSSTAVTVNRVCISGMEAVISGMSMIQTGIFDVVLAGGVEHMSGAEYSVPAARWGCRLQDHTFVDRMIRGLYCGTHLTRDAGEGPVNSEAEPLSLFVGKSYIMGHTAEFVAQHLDISREEMDEIALRSHNNIERATNEDVFKDEIIPIEVPRRKKDPVIFKKDEHFRPGLTMDDLTKLPPAFIPKIGKVTAGNSSGLNDGAAAMVLMTEDKARELGLKPLAKIKAVGAGGCHPSIMGLSPVPAVNQLLDKSGYKVEDFEMVEVNEAFASQYIGCERELGLNREITNMNGSGIGIGHPVGATGARIIVTLIHALRRQGKSLGLATLCGGGGISMAVALEMM